MQFAGNDDGIGTVIVDKKRVPAERNVTAAT